MFNSQTAQVPLGEIETQPELLNLNVQLIKANAEYLDILYTVEDKMHGILNLRSPEKSATVSEQPQKSINDFVGSIQDQIQVYRIQNARLQKVLDHVKRIIG